MAYTELRKGSRKEICPNCGRRSFTPYVWTLAGAERYGVAAGSMVDGDHGKCDHESSCAYFLKLSFDDIKQLGGGWQVVQPRRQQPRQQPRQEIPAPPPLAYVENRLLLEGMQRLKQPHTPCLFDYMRERLALCRGIDAEAFDEVLAAYMVGLAADGAVIFPRLSYSRKICHSVKYMRYIGLHRDKSGGGAFNFEKGRGVGLTGEEYKPLSLLFGWHLAEKYPDRPLAIAESEKSALAAAACYPQFVWLATGGLGNLTPERLAGIDGEREITCVPDCDGVDNWLKRIEGGKFDDWNAVVRSPFDFDGRAADTFQIYECGNLDIGDVLLCDYDGIVKSVGEVLAGQGLTTKLAAAAF